MTSSVKRTPGYTAMWILVGEGVIVLGAIIFALIRPSAGSWQLLTPIDNRFVRAIVAALIVFHFALLLMLLMQRIAPKSVLMKHLSSGVYMGLIMAFLSDSATDGSEVRLAQAFLFFATWFALWSWGMSRFFPAKVTNPA